MLKPLKAGATEEDIQSYHKKLDSLKPKVSEQCFRSGSGWWPLNRYGSNTESDSKHGVKQFYLQFNRQRALLVCGICMQRGRRSTATSPNRPPMSPPD